MLMDPIKDREGFSLSDIQKKVIQNDIPMEIFEAEVERRRNLGLLHEKYRCCFKRLKSEWEPKLKERGLSIPQEPDEFASLVFSQTDYKNRSQREAERPKMF